MASETGKWSINRQISISVLVQLIFLASLIIGTWVNIQRQLCLMQHDIKQMIQTQQQFQEKMQTLNNMCIGFEYRLRAIEDKKDKTQTR